jgi:type II secretory pathway pseudopilin PulG
MKTLAMQRTTEAGTRRGAAGFSLLELMIALGVTVVVSGLAVSLLTASFNIRTREDRKADAIADVRRSLSAMTREIANAGYGLPSGFPVNGIVAGDSNTNSIRILSNSDRFAGGATPAAPTSQDEDVIYRFVNDPVTNQRYVLRYDVNSAIGGTSVLANRIDSFVIRYYSRKVVYTTGNCDISNVLDAAGGTAVAEVAPAQANYVVLSICVQLQAVGSPGSHSYQPPTVQQLTSDVQLRNATAASF